MTGNWKQFSRIPWDETVATVVRVLGIDVPTEGRPVSYQCGGFIASRTSDGLWVVMGNGKSAHFVEGPKEVLRVAKLTKGTPSGDALRQWLEMWGEP